MSIRVRQACLEQLSNIISARLVGDGSYQIDGIATLEHASPSDLAFFSNRKYFNQLKKSQAGVVILAEQDLEFCPTNALVVNDPYLAYARVAHWLTAEESAAESSIHETAVIEQEVILGKGVTIGAHCVIQKGTSIGDGARIEAGCVIGKNVSIGKNCILYPNVSIYQNAVLGERVILHSGCVIGADGFGIANAKGKWIKVPQLGTVVLGDDVEVGANTTIDRGAIENTVIENGVKLDNLIQIAHNVRIGENSALAGCVGVAGSTSIGRNCAIGGGAGILGHLEIVDNVHITATSLVTKSITRPGVYSSGTPLQENAQWHKNFARFKQLDDMARTLKKLEAQVIKAEKE